MDLRGLLFVFCLVLAAPLPVAAQQALISPAKSRLSPLARLVRVLLPGTRTDAAGTTRATFRLRLGDGRMVKHRVAIDRNGRVNGNIRDILRRAPRRVTVGGETRYRTFWLSPVVLPTDKKVGLPLPPLKSD